MANDTLTRIVKLVNFFKISLGINFTMLRFRNFLIFLFAVKFFLDFMSPFREINFLIFNTISLSFLFIKIKLIQLRKAECLWIVLYLMCCTLWLVLGNEYRYFIKFASVVIIYLAIKLSVNHLNIKDIEYVCKRVLTFFAIFMLCNYFISLISAAPLSRQFFNFEHANLLGSYTLLPLAFVYSLILIKKGQQFIGKLIVILAAFLSTSTGSILCSLIPLVNIKKITLKNILIGLLCVIVFTSATYEITRTYSPSLFIKLFGTFRLFLDGNGGELLALAGNPQNHSVSQLGYEYNNSLTWRLCHYLIFTNFFLEQSLIPSVIGNGFGGWSYIRDAVMPHNDFLLILIDLGVLGLGLTLYILKKAFFSCVEKEFLLLPLLLVLVLRLLLANNIYSYYLFSSLVMNGTFLFFVILKIRTRHSCNIKLL